MNWHNDIHSNSRGVCWDHDVANLGSPAREFENSASHRVTSWWGLCDSPNLMVYISWRNTLEPIFFSTWIMSSKAKGTGWNKTASSLATQVVEGPPSLFHWSTEIASNFCQSKGQCLSFGSHYRNRIAIVGIWRFPEIGVPLNHPFYWDFPLQTKPSIWVSPFIGNLHMVGMLVTLIPGWLGIDLDASRC